MYVGGNRINHKKKMKIIYILGIQEAKNEDKTDRCRGRNLFFFFLLSSVSLLLGGLGDRYSFFFFLRFSILFFIPISVSIARVEARGFALCLDPFAFLTGLSFLPFS